MGALGRACTRGGDRRRGEKRCADNDPGLAPCPLPSRFRLAQPPGRRRNASIRQERAPTFDDRALAPSAPTNCHQALWRHRPHPGGRLRAGGRRHEFCRPHGRSGAAVSRGWSWCGLALAAASGGDHGALPVRLGHEAAGRASVRGPHRANSRADAGDGLWPVARALPAICRYRAAGCDGLGIRSRRAAVSGERHGGPVRPIHAGFPASGRSRAPAAIPCGRSSAGECRLELARARDLGMRGCRGERIADRPNRPAVASPRAVAPARDRHRARPPRPQRHLDRHPRAGASRRAGQPRALGGRLQGQVDRALAEEG